MLKSRSFPCNLRSNSSRCHLLLFKPFLDSNAMSGNKGNWIALFVFGGLKGATGLVLMIVGIILMAHSPGDCSSIAQCYQEKGIDCYRRLSDTNLTQPLYSEDLQSIPPGAKEMGRDALGKVVRDVLGIKLLDHMALLKGEPLADHMALKGTQASTRQLAVTCNIDEDQCNADMQALSDAAGSWGMALLIIGLIGSLSGILSFLAAKKKLRSLMGISMAIDIIMMFVCVAMWFLCGAIASGMHSICEWFQEESAKDGAPACWEDINSTTCSWADLFGTATIMFLIMFFVELGTSIA